MDPRSWGDLGIACGRRTRTVALPRWPPRPRLIWPTSNRRRSSGLGAVGDAQSFEVPVIFITAFRAVPDRRAARTGV
jgi:hypothetical protein